MRADCLLCEVAADLDETRFVLRERRPFFADRGAGPVRHHAFFIAALTPRVDAELRARFLDHRTQFGAFLRPFFAFGRHERQHGTQQQPVSLPRTSRGENDEQPAACRREVAPFPAPRNSRADHCRHQAAHPQAASVRLQRDDECGREQEPHEPSSITQSRDRKQRGDRQNIRGRKQRLRLNLLLVPKHERPDRGERRDNRNPKSASSRDVSDDPAHADERGQPRRVLHERREARRRARQRRERGEDDGINPAPLFTDRPFVFVPEPFRGREVAVGIGTEISFRQHGHHPEAQRRADEECGQAEEDAAAEGEWFGH